MRAALLSTLLSSVCLVSMTAGCCGTDEATLAIARPIQAIAASVSPTPGIVERSDTTTVVEMRNVHFRVDSHLTLQIRLLQGHMRPTDGFAHVDFGNPESFSLDLAHAEIGMSTDHLAYLMQRYVFGYEGAPLTIGRIEAEGATIRQTGTLHNVVDIPFEMTAEVSADADGRIRMHPTSMLICSIPGQGLMRALGIELEQLLDLTGASGVEADGNDLLLDPAQLLPPPAIRGRVTAVRVEGNDLVQIFGSPDASPVIPVPSMPDAENYMFYSGGILQFGKLFMVEADLQIIDDDPTDPFDFFLREYMAQLVAGRSHTMSDAGLAAYLPDFEDIPGAAD